MVAFKAAVKYTMVNKIKRQILWFLIFISLFSTILQIIRININGTKHDTQNEQYANFVRKVSLLFIGNKTVGSMIIIVM